MSFLILHKKCFFLSLDASQGVLHLSRQLCLDLGPFFSEFSARGFLWIFSKWSFVNFRPVNFCEFPDREFAREFLWISISTCFDFPCEFYVNFTWIFSESVVQCFCGRFARRKIHVKFTRKLKKSTREFTKNSQSIHGHFCSRLHANVIEQYPRPFILAPRRAARQLLFSGALKNLRLRHS